MPGRQVVIIISSQLISVKPERQHRHNLLFFIFPVFTNIPPKGNRIIAIRNLRKQPSMATLVKKKHTARSK